MTSDNDGVNVKFLNLQDNYIEVKVFVSNLTYIDFVDKMSKF